MSKKEFNKYQEMLEDIRMQNKDEYPAMSVAELKVLCDKLVELGLGANKILISSDDEGNEFHGLFYGFNINSEDIKGYQEYGCFHDRVDANEVVLLG